MQAPTRGVEPGSSQPEQAGCLSTIARIIWIMVGNFALVVVLGLVVQRRSFSYLDIVFWAVAGVVCFVRYADIKWLRGLGTDGQPTTLKDWPRYARLFLLVAGSAWVVVHILAFVLRR